MPVSISGHLSLSYWFIPNEINFKKFSGQDFKYFWDGQRDGWKTVSNASAEWTNLILKISNISPLNVQKYKKVEW